MSYTNVQWTEMVRLYAAAGDNLNEARRMYAELFPGQPVPNRETMLAATQRVTSMQPDVVEALQRAGINARLLTEPDPRLEVPVLVAGSETNRPYRVLYLALSPDGDAIVTAAGDDTLRFWNIFSKTPSHKENKSVLNLYTALR